MGDNSAGVLHSTRYCCFGAAGGLAAGAIVSAGLVFLVLVLVLSLLDFVFFGVLGQRQALGRSVRARLTLAARLPAQLWL